MAKLSPKKVDTLLDNLEQSNNNHNISHNVHSDNKDLQENIGFKERSQQITLLPENQTGLVRNNLSPTTVHIKSNKFKKLSDRILIPSSEAFKKAQEAHAETAFEQTEFLRKTILLRLFALILLGCFGEGPFTVLLVTIIIGKIEPLLITDGFLSVAAALCFAWSYLLAGRGVYRLATWITVLGFWFSFGYACWLLGSNVPVFLGFLVLLSFSAILMNGSEILALTGMVLIFGCGLYSVEHVFKIYQAALSLPDEIGAIFNIITSVAGLSATIAIQYYPNKSQIRALQAQNERLQQTLSALEARQNNSQTVSQEVLTLAEGLNATSEQQASGSLRQVGAITQVSAAMTELGTAATHIAELAEQVSQAAEAMGGRTEEIEVSTRQAASQTELGLAAAESTVTTSEEVAELYEGLLSTTEDLTTKTAEMQRIMTLTGTIATEIHLLSLNASIEAAGAGQHGDRFRVVAQAVKDLAQRSFTASTEVIGVVSQVETAVQLANASTQQGFEKARKMAQIARRTGDVITGLQRVADQSQSQAVLIASMLDEVQGQINTIRTATFQQKNASQQVQSALHELSDLARDVAQGSKAISSNSVELRETAEHLKITLFEEEIINH
jgi:methyl-accepting chemotaxis protein